MFEFYNPYLEGKNIANESPHVPVMIWSSFLTIVLEYSYVKSPGLQF